MEINLAVKSSQNENQLERALKIAEKYDVRGIEIQEIIPTMQHTKTEYRAKIVIGAVKRHDNIEFLAYHFPIKSRWDSISEAKEYDLAWGSEKIMSLSRETIREAAIVAYKLDIDNQVPVNFHLFRFVEKDKISLQEKIKGLKIGEDSLLKLKEYASNVCKEFGLYKGHKEIIRITRENNPPDHGFVDGLIDYHPDEISRTQEVGIYNCLDFAHIQQYMNYLKNGKGELPGVDLDKKLYPVDIDWSYVIDKLKVSTALVHLNDALGYRKETEGLEVGAGEINYIEVFKTIKKVFRNLNEIIFTVEIKDGHIHPEKIENSIFKMSEILEII